MSTFRATVMILTFAVGSLFGSGHAQSQDVSLQAELLKDWSALKATMHKMAAELPADKYVFRPTDAQQTFGERALHVATVNVALLSTLGETGIPKPTIDPNATTKDAVLKALDESFDYGIAL